MASPHEGPPQSHEPPEDAELARLRAQQETARRAYQDKDGKYRDRWGQYEEFSTMSPGDLGISLEEQAEWNEAKQERQRLWNEYQGAASAVDVYEATPAAGEATSSQELPEESTREATPSIAEPATAENSELETTNTPEERLARLKAEYRSGFGTILDNMFEAGKTGNHEEAYKTINLNTYGNPDDPPLFSPEEQSALIDAYNIGAETEGHPHYETTPEITLPEPPVVERQPVVAGGETQQSAPEAETADKPQEVANTALEESEQRLDEARTEYARLSVAAEKQAKDRPREHRDVGEGQPSMRINLLREDITPIEGLAEAETKYLAAVQEIRKLRGGQIRAQLEREEAFAVQNLTEIPSQKEIQKRMDALIEETVIREGIALYDEKTRLRLTSEHGFPHPDRAWKCVQKAAEWYNNLDAYHRDPTKSRFHWQNLPRNKILISAGLFCASLGAGFAGLTAAGVIVGGMKTLQRGLGGAAVGVATDAGIQRLFQYRREKRTLKGLETVQGDLADLSLELNDILYSNDEKLNKRLLAFEKDAAKRRGKERIISQGGGVLAGVVVGGGYAAQGIRGGLGYFGITPAWVAEKLGISKDISVKLAPKPDAPIEPVVDVTKLDTSAPAPAIEPPPTTDPQQSAPKAETSPAPAAPIETPPPAPPVVSEPAPDTAATTEKPSAATAPRTAIEVTRAVELTTVRKGEGAWQAVRRQFYERIKTEPTKYGMSAEEAQKLPELGKLGKGTKAAKILNRETLATLKNAGYINADGTTKLGMRPDARVILSPDNKITLEYEGKGKPTYPFSEQKTGVGHPADETRRGRGAGGRSYRDYTADMRVPDETAQFVADSMPEEGMTSAEYAASPAGQVAAEAAAVKTESANLRTAHLTKGEYRPITQMRGETFIKELDRHATEINEYRAHGGRKPDIFINRGALTARGFRVELPQAEKYLDLSERLEKHLKTLRSSERARLLKQPLGELMRSFSLTKNK